MLSYGGAGKSSAARLADFAKFAVRPPCAGVVPLWSLRSPATALWPQDSIDGGICRLAAVAITQTALNNVKAKLYAAAATRIQAAERGRQARNRFLPRLAAWRRARARRLLESGLKLGVLTVLFVVLLLLWIRDSKPRACIQSSPLEPSCTPPAPAPVEPSCQAEAVDACRL